MDFFYSTWIFLLLRTQQTACQKMESIAAAPWTKFALCGNANRQKAMKHSTKRRREAEHMFPLWMFQLSFIYIIPDNQRFPQDYRQKAWRWNEVLSFICNCSDFMCFDGKNEGLKDILRRVSEWRCFQPHLPPVFRWSFSVFGSDTYLQIGHFAGQRNETKLTIFVIKLTEIILVVRNEVFIIFANTILEYGLWNTLTNFTSNG
jgi:hypothetical protein